MIDIAGVYFPLRSMFQSLFSWNLLLMSTNINLEDFGTLFQSLFSWNLLLMYNSSSRSALWGPVSILVFVELALDACHAER